MSIPQHSIPAKLIVGLFMKDKTIIGQIVEAFIKEFGKIDIVSPWFDFNHTNYYDSEMGTPLFRRIFSFQTLIKQTSLPDIKTFTTTIEKLYENQNKRQVNIDPGYLLKERFVLATYKNYTHRIYIGKKTFADLTMIYQKGSFQSLPWTYPDYAEKNIKSFIELVREKYLIDLKN